jgi:hypothetical protein
MPHFQSAGRMPYAAAAETCPDRWADIAERRATPVAASDSGRAQPTVDRPAFTDEPMPDEAATGKCAPIRR